MEAEHESGFWRQGEVSYTILIWRYKVAMRRIYNGHGESRRPRATLQTQARALKLVRGY
ncbi:hypothetical protein NC651_027203 [Populus alba x Populus x berolinensis]|nr:hypothetical protein NC651_027203 [Populus alba x Populus x berolinensis]